MGEAMTGDDSAAIRCTERVIPCLLSLAACPVESNMAAVKRLHTPMSFEIKYCNYLLNARLREYSSISDVIYSFYFLFSLMTCFQTCLISVPSFGAIDRD
jgi:hypothetical protein